MLSCGMSVAQPLPLDHAVGRTALRKASLRLIPLLFLGYGIAYMDRVNISFASLQMNRDLTSARPSMASVPASSL